MSSTHDSFRFVSLPSHWLSPDGIEGKDSNSPYIWPISSVSIQVPLSKQILKASMIYEYLESCTISDTKVSRWKIMVSNSRSWAGYYSYETLISEMHMLSISLPALTHNLIHFERHQYTLCASPWASLQLGESSFVLLGICL